MKDRYCVAGIGEVLWDVFPEGEQLGGAPANVACQCARLGAQAYLISCVGNDDRGVRARNYLRGHGVDLSCLAVSSEFETGVVNIVLDAQGKPAYEIREGVAWDHIPWSEDLKPVLARLDAICFGTLAQRGELSRSCIESCLAGVPEKCLRVFDVNLRMQFYSREILRRSLEAANALKLNDEELPVLAAMFGLSGTDREQLEQLMDIFDLRIAALTCGAKGAWMMTREEADFSVSPEITVVDTVGAGDAFTAAMITGFLAGNPLSEINRDANALAAYICTVKGALPSLPESGEVP